MGKQIAVVLAGAVAKGAFEAGALAELTTRDVSIRRIVASSAGALNGSVLAAAVHSANKPEDITAKMETLCNTWIEKGDIWHAFHFRLFKALCGIGGADHKKLLQQLHSQIEPAKPGSLENEIDLTMIVSPLKGEVSEQETEEGKKEKTSSFELPMPFSGKDFVTPEGVRRVIDATAASASFPGAFIPFDLPGHGPCIDGGTVNNTPLKYALAGPDPVDTVVVIAPTPADNSFSEAMAKDLHYFGLIGRLADMLINERIYRDLKEARETNAALKNIESNAKLKDLKEEILTAIGWGPRKQVEIISIRPHPKRPLPGNGFSGFIERKLRKQYVEIGQETAKEVLDAKFRRSTA